MHTRHVFRLGVGLAAIASAHAATKPNVILIITDDQGYGDLACHGNPYIKTPNLDTLYSQSTRLTDYHVGPTCAPTRAGLMTGRYCNATGVWHTIMGRSLLRKDEKTMADTFKTGGYATGFYGKWHLGDNAPFLPSQRGFDDVWRHGGGGIGQTPDYFGNDYFDDTYWINGKPTAFEGYCTDIWFKGAKQFIAKNAKADKPFFAYVSTNAPHGPFNVAKKYADAYADNPNVPNANFYGMIANIDENVGALMKQLDDLGIADDTILIFTTDNGTSAGVGRAKKSKGKGKPTEIGFSAGMRGRKGSEYEGGHRVPMFIRWPNGKITAGKDVPQLTAHIDMIPTLAELCGIDLPKGGQPLDGKSLVPLLRGSGVGWPDRTIVTDSQRLEKLVKWRKCATMTQQWRLINGKELYDVKKDPGQRKDVAAEFPEVVKRLRADYETWWSKVSARGNEYCPIIIGMDRVTTERLTAHDWHVAKGMPPWNQSHIKRGRPSMGFWVVDVAKAGTYELTLRRWPKEGAVADTPIREKFLAVTNARLTIGDVDETKPVDATATSVTFTVTLPAGHAQIRTWFMDAKGKSGGAFYVYAKRL